MTQATPGLAPELTYEPSECTRALLNRACPHPPEWAYLDNGGLDVPTISRMRRTNRGYHAGCGHRIAAARKRAGLTQEELAAVVDRSAAMICCYELNYHSIPHRTALLIADALDISLDELLHGRDERGTVAAD